jgi:transposase
MTAKRSKKTRKPPKKSGNARNCPRLGGDDARLEGMRLLAEGLRVLDVAEQLGVDEKTVRRWRDSPEGAKELAAAREARAATFANAAEDARRVLREATARAAQVLVEQLDESDPAARSLAARTILDRVGVPRTERVEAVVAPAADLSRLTDDELAQYEALRAKARG